RRSSDLITELQPTTVIVGVLDSGVDIEHEDLKNVIWTNEGEIPGNNIDDDKNGFVDDVHGWNFLGEANHEQLEYVRILSKGDDGSDLYKRAKAEYEKEYDKTLKNKTRYEQIMQSVTEANALLQEELGKETYTLEDLNQLESEDEKILQAKAAMSQMLTFEESVEALKEELKGGIEYFTGRLNYNLNKDYDGRSIVGDDPENIEDTNYGNNNVIGDKEHAKHGTHVAGIIAAERNNSIGMNGVAEHVKIMSVRTV